MRYREERIPFGGPAEGDEAVGNEPAPRVPGIRWGAHRAMLAPFLWMGATAATGIAPHYLAHGLAKADVVAGSAVIALVRVLAGRRGRRGRQVRYMAACALAAVAWVAVAAYKTWAGPHGVMLLALIGGGVCMAAPGMWRHRRRPPAAPAAVTLPPGPDLRLKAFREAFCQSGPLAGAALSGLEDIRDGDGFRFDIRLAPGTQGTVRDVISLRERIAKLYDVGAEQVTVEHQRQHRSEGRATVAVLTRQGAITKVTRWDGKSTYNPADGTITIGSFMDGTPARWQLHKPGSGAFGGVIAGVTGGGKSGSGHVIAAEAGLAQIGGQRIAAVLMGDPQMQPFSVWRGRAEVTAWGPLACVELLRWLAAITKLRARYLSEVEWTDARGRPNKGKGWFDPEPGLPLIKCMIDEWHLLTGPQMHPALVREAIGLAAMVIKAGRKTGVELDLFTPLPDLTEIGERAIRELLKAVNVLGHRTDGLSSSMLGLKGDTSVLPADVPGIGYINGPDNRPATTFRTKWLPENAAAYDLLPDVRHLAEVIASTPVMLDDAVLRAIRPLGWTGPGHVITDDDSGVYAPAPEGPPDDAPDRLAPRPGDDPNLMTAVIACLMNRTQEDGSADVYDLMKDTGLTLLDVTRALAALTATGLAQEIGDGRYAIAR
jgi:hypothetical protein